VGGCRGRLRVLRRIDPRLPCDEPAAVGSQTRDGQGGREPLARIRALTSMDAPSERSIDPDLARRGERRLGGANATFTPSGAGVSSELWRRDAGDKTFCVKRALPRLNVAADWQAPVRRNVEEVKWLRFAATVAPRQVPAVIADDPDAHVAVLGWFDPQRWTNW